MPHTAEYRDPALAEKLLVRIRARSRKAVRLMEVCGTHTVAIMKSGIRSLLPGTIDLLSGPGCPVCVTDQAEIDAFVALAREKDVIIATFGDLMRVPGSGSSLLKERAAGCDIRVVYSTMDALDLARQHPRREVVFLGVGFETTAPTVAAAILAARQENVTNFSVFCAHKQVPPALCALMQPPDNTIDGFLLPGHVSVIIGLDAYQPFVDTFQVPCVVAGFEPVDILKALLLLIEQLEEGRADLLNAYPRAVTAGGNPTARKVLDQVFEPADARWRGIGTIAGSGLAIREDFASFDAARRWKLDMTNRPVATGCACGRILTGRLRPLDCPLFGKACTPADPVGPCMVSSEGTCAAYYRYHTP